MWMAKKQEDRQGEQMGDPRLQMVTISIVPSKAASASSNRVRGLARRMTRFSMEHPLHKFQLPLQPHGTDRRGFVGSFIAETTSPIPTSPAITPQPMRNVWSRTGMPYRCDEKRHGNEEEMRRQGQM